MSLACLWFRGSKVYADPPLQTGRPTTTGDRYQSPEVTKKSPAEVSYQADLLSPMHKETSAKKLIGAAVLTLKTQRGVDQV